MYLFFRFFLAYLRYSATSFPTKAGKGRHFLAAWKNPLGFRIKNVLQLRIVKSFDAVSSKSEGGYRKIPNEEIKNK